MRKRRSLGKAARASLNISTYIALYSYGYRNVYELGPLLDVHATKLPLEGSLLLQRHEQQARSER